MINGILAIDFDDTIAEVDWPRIVRINMFAREAISRLAEEGWHIIINTCRTGQQEDEARIFLKINGIPYHGFNENHPALIAVFENECRKISADIYIDDKNLDQIGKPINWRRILTEVRDAERFIKKPLLERFKNNGKAKEDFKTVLAFHRPIIQPDFNYKNDRSGPAKTKR